MLSRLGSSPDFFYFTIVGVIVSLVLSLIAAIKGRWWWIFAPFAGAAIVMVVYIAFAALLGLRISGNLFVMREYLVIFERGKDADGEPTPLIFLVSEWLLKPARKLRLSSAKASRFTSQSYAKMACLSPNPAPSQSASP